MPSHSTCQNDCLSAVFLLFHLFSFVFYCEPVARASVAILWNNRLVENQVDAHVQHVNTKYARLQKSNGARTILVMIFASLALYTDPHITCKKAKYALSRQLGGATSCLNFQMQPPVLVLL